MLLDLPESSEILMKYFKAKLRSQIKKPLKEGLKPKVGGIELLYDFYKVFSINMRDLGSPVHSQKLMRIVFEEFIEYIKDKYDGQYWHASPKGMARFWRESIVQKSGY